MSPILYGFSSAAIAFVLFALILIANEAGYRGGRRQGSGSDEGARAQTNSIQAAMLGLLALLLGFTFTMALQRFDSRSQAVIEEANAIGTAYLRSDLLSGQARRDARALLAEYVELRLRAGEVDLTQTEARREAKAGVNALHERLWSVALEASALDARPATTGLFIQSLNELIDSHGRRDAALKKHVPEVVLLLLFAVFVISGAVLGYAGGLAGARPIVATVSMALLIVLVIFIIIDLDRPRRGIIRVNQDSMHDLGAAFSDHDAAVLDGAADPAGPRIAAGLPATLDR